MNPPCIVAMGGGGFSMEPEHLALDRYLLGLCDTERPKVCFLPTASGDNAAYIERFYTSFRSLNCEPSHLGLFAATHRQPAAHLVAQDLIYVGGGNTFNMLQLWRAHGLDKALHQAWQNGVVCAGLSAGSICWFEAGLTDSFGPQLEPLGDGLGWLAGSHCPHYDGEAQRRPRYEALVAGGELPGGVAADDGVALRYTGSRLVEVVSSRPGRSAYRVVRQDSGLHVEALEPRLLPGC
jgi:dipeptidase E